MSVFIIAEAGSSHDNDIEKAYRLIEAAKACDSDAVKFQWTSSGGNMARRRGLDSDAALMYGTLLEKPVSWLESLKAHADKVGIEFMCTVYLIEDIPVVAPLVSRFKVSAFESGWERFRQAHEKYGKQIIVSVNPQDLQYPWYGGEHGKGYVWLHCISEYPTPVEKLRLSFCRKITGFSDHSTSLISGAVAVGAGAVCIEKHIKLPDTDKSNPDFPHSLFVPSSFRIYVENIREAEKAL